MLRRWIVASLCAVLLLSLAAPAALAQEDPDVISGVTIESATIDTETGVPTVTVSVTCLVDVPLVRARATLTQSRGSGRVASSLQPGAFTSCQAGEVLIFAIRFGPQQGTFVPGPAEITGFVEAILVCCISADLESIGPTTVVLRPARQP
jgi:hypothetical protein